jgi:hypothetical protein
MPEPHRCDKEGSIVVSQFIKVDGVIVDPAPGGGWIRGGPSVAR